MYAQVTRLWIEVTAEKYLPVSVGSDADLVFTNEGDGDKGDTS